MDRLRWISASILIPISVVVAYIGGLPYALYVAGVLWLAASEYVTLLHSAYRPSRPLVLGATLAFVAGAFFTAEYGRGLIATYSGLTLAAHWPEWALLTTLVLLLAAMTWHVLDHERGALHTATDWALTVSGGLYLGLFAAHYVLIREGLGPDGRWWALIVLAAQWLADSAALFVGRRYGRHKMTPRLSPGKSWEGYAAGITAGLLTGALTGALSPLVAGWIGETTRVTWLSGLAVGGLCATLSPLGDLGESMIKRQVSMKDSSNLLPGHGGMLDRTDSLLWAVVIGYYFFVIFVR